MIVRKLLLTTTMLAGVMAAGSGVAYAQTPPPSPPTTAENGTTVEEVVVTGSRIRRSEFTSAAPVQIITSEGSTLEGLVDAAEILQSSTIASGSTQINNTFTGFVINGGPGVNTISLRGLGDQRTLVLLNGRRLPPAGVQGQVAAVDLNILPESMIDRYEILKDGASSIYGSDAIAGVVNIITRRNLDGGELNAEGTVSEHGGGEEYSLSGAWGKVFDKGHFMVSGYWYHREPLTMADRPWLDCAEPYTFDPTTGARNDMIDFRTGKTKCISSSGNIVGYTPVNEALGIGNTLLGYAFYGSRVPLSVNGPRASAPPDPRIPAYRFIALDERNFNPDAENDTTVISPVDRYTIFADGTYDLGQAEAYGEVLLHRRESEQLGYQTIFHLVSEQSPCPVNPFNCPGASTLTKKVSPGFTVGSLKHFGFAPETRFISPIHQEQEIDVYRVMGGLRGTFTSDFLKDWTWDGYLSYSTSRGDYTTTGIYNDRMAAVTGTDIDANFLGVCPPGSFSGCTGLNLFSDEILSTGRLPQNLRDILQFSETGNTRYDQFIAEFSVAGDLFKLPAGPVGAAFGASYRRDALNDQPGPEAVAQNFWGLATAGPTKGNDGLKELYGELELPILRGHPFVEDLTLNVSGRVSDYESYGTSSTYKLGANWRINSQLRLRGTYGTSFRAPALFEQFLNNQTAFLAQSSVDPCIRYGESTNNILKANCASEGLAPTFAGGGSSAQLSIGGGKDLKAEESKASSLGVVWTAEFADLNVAVDYWSIEVNNEVTSLAASVVGQCYASPDFPNNEFCGLFVREPTGTRDISFIDASYRNITSQKSRGLDLTTRYTRQVGPGKVTADAQVTWTFDDTLELFAGKVDDFNGLIGEPKVVANASLKYDWKDWTFTYSGDFIGKQSNVAYQFGKECDLVGNYAFAGPAGFAPYCAVNHVDPFWYHDFSVRYRAPKWTVVAGVRNAFDKEPQKVSDPISPDKGLFTYGRLGMTSGATQNDYVGRRYFVSLTRTF